MELQFAHSLPNHHRVAHAGMGAQGLTAGTHQTQLQRHAGEEELHVLQAHDRWGGVVSWRQGQNAKSGEEVAHACIKGSSGVAVMSLRKTDGM